MLKAGTESAGDLLEVIAFKRHLNSGLLTLQILLLLEATCSPLLGYV